MTDAENLHDSVANLVTALLAASDSLSDVDDPRADLARDALRAAFRDVVGLRGKIHELHKRNLARQEAAAVASTPQLGRLHNGARRSAFNPRFTIPSIAGSGWLASR